MARVLCGIVIAATIAACAAAAVASDTALTSVQDSEGRFTIDVPAGWQVDRSRRDRALSARSPEPAGTSPDTLEVFVRDTPVPLSPQGCLGQVAWVMRMTIHTWTTLSERPETIGGHAAYTREYTWRLNTGEERRSIQTCLTVGRRAFVIIGTTMNSPLRVVRSLPELTRMIATFRPGPASPPADAGERDPTKER